MTDKRAKIILSKEERETIINFSDSEDTATVYTCNPSLMRQLKQKGYTLVTKTDISATFQCPKRCISFRNPVYKPRKPLTDEQKAKLAEARQARLEL